MHAYTKQESSTLLLIEFVLRTCMHIKLNTHVVETNNAKLFFLCMFLSGPLFVRRMMAWQDSERRAANCFITCHCNEKAGRADT